MDRLSNGSKSSSGRRGNSGRPNGPDDGGPSKADPRSRSVNRSGRADEFSRFQEEILRDLNPRGPLHRIAADHVIQSAWRLKGSLERQASRVEVEASDPEKSTTRVRVRPSELDQASRSLREAVGTFESIGQLAPLIQRDTVPVAEKFVDFREADTDIFPNEWPIVPSEDPEDSREELESSDEFIATWRDRLVYDFDVSDISPVVKGTWVTVGHVVSLIVDGWGWADVLRSHPELSEEDIRACVAYAMDEENTAP